MSQYNSNSIRHSLLGHLSFGVRSMKISEPFYTAIMKTLGVEKIYQDHKEGPKSIGYGWEDREPFTLFENSNAAPHGKGTHLAFNALNRKAVDEFYDAALKNGGRGDGDPGLRNEVNENYYCCFVFDPDGHRLEAVFQEVEEKV